MNPYPHHQSLAGSPHHHPPSEPHHGYGSSASGNGTTATTPDPSPHSPAYGTGPQDPGTQVYPTHQQQQQQHQQGGMTSNGHHHSAMMQQQVQDHQQQQHHHRPYQHPHMTGHMGGYPQVNHNNNCTIKVKIVLFFYSFQYDV